MYLTKLFPWYCIDYLKFGDPVLFTIPFEEHPWGVKMGIFLSYNEIWCVHRFDTLREVPWQWRNKTIYPFKWLVDNV